MTEPEKKGSCLWTLVKLVLLLIVVVVVVVVGVGYLVLDGKYDVSREAKINASPEAIHKEVGDLREWPHWLPFTKHDKTIKVTIEQPTGVGANQHWTGDSGNGELTFTKSDPETGIDFDMLFDKKFASKGSITYDKAGDETRVTWRMTGENDGLLGRWMAFATPYMIGPMFDEGLKDLKKQVEAK
jgi:hypothetical protein